MTQELIAHLFHLAKEYSRLSGDITEHVPFEDYNHILEYEIKLNAFGNLLSVTDTAKFLQEEINAAESYLASVRHRLGISDCDNEEAR